jgi:hypothetical protein
MKQFFSKVKNLSQKAAELKAAMQQLPPKVAEVRQTIAATAGQLQQLRVDVQSTVADLKADNEQRISQAMLEINASLDVFLEAGFELSGVDLEISPVERLLIHLSKREDVHPSAIRSLISANQHRKTTHALLTALLQAHEMAETVELPELDYTELIVGIGPIPSVRICWRVEEAPEAHAVPTTAQTLQVPPPIAAPAPATLSAFGQSSFFEKLSSQPAPVAAKTTAPIAAATKSPVAEAEPAEESRETETTHGLPPAEKQDPLARFKKMPDLSKYKK